MAGIGSSPPVPRTSTEPTCEVPAPDVSAPPCSLCMPCRCVGPAGDAPMGIVGSSPPVPRTSTEPTCTVPCLGCVPVNGPPSAAPMGGIGSSPPVPRTRTEPNLRSAKHKVASAFDHYPRSPAHTSHKAMHCNVCLLCATNPKLGEMGEGCTTFDEPTGPQDTAPAVVTRESDMQPEAR